MRVITRDGALKVSLPPSTITLTTTGNIDDLDFSNADVIRMNNASDATIRGLKAGYDGQEVTIISVGAGNVFMANGNAGSSAVNRLNNRLTTWLTPLAANSKGMAKYRYDATTQRWRLGSHEQGANINVAYSSGNFSSDAGTWTVDSGDQVTFAYWVKDKHVKFSVTLNTTTVSGGPVVLQVTMPGQSNESTFVPARVIDNNVGKVGLYRVVATDATLRIYMDMSGSATWAAATNATSVMGYILFEGV